MAELATFINLADAIKLATVVFISIALLMLEHYAIKRLLDGRKWQYWQFYLLKSLNIPLKIMIILTGIVFLVEILYKKANLEILNTVKLLIITSCLTWIILSFIRKLEKHFLKYHSFSNQKDKDVKHSTLILLTKLCFITSLIIGGLIFLQTLGVKMQAIITFLSLSGVAIGIASRDLTAGLFGTMMIYISSPFVIGDRIKINLIEGLVEDITWISTRLRLENKRVVYIPNILFLNSSVENITQASEKKLKIIFSVSTPQIHSAMEALEALEGYIKEQKTTYHDEQINPRVSFEITEIHEGRTIAKFNLFFYKHTLPSDILSIKKNLSTFANTTFRDRSMRFNLKFED